MISQASSAQNWTFRRVRTREEGEEALRAAVDDVNLVQSHRVHDLLPAIAATMQHSQVSAELATRSSRGSSRTARTYCFCSSPCGHCTKRVCARTSTTQRTNEALSRGKRESTRSHHWPHGIIVVRARKRPPQPRNLARRLVDRNNVAAKAHRIFRQDSPDNPVFLDAHPLVTFSLLSESIILPPRS